MNTIYAVTATLCTLVLILRWC